jgi:hypothetical protein
VLLQADSVWGWVSRGRVFCFGFWVLGFGCCCPLRCLVLPRAWRCVEAADEGGLRVGSDAAGFRKRGRTAREGGSGRCLAAQRVRGVCGCGCGAGTLCLAWGAGVNDCECGGAQGGGETGRW